MPNNFDGTLGTGYPWSFMFAAAALLCGLILGASPTLAQNSYMGQYTANPYAANRLTMPQPGVMDSPYASGSSSPKLYDGAGNFRGNLNTNKYDADSVSNPYGRYGNQYSADSINNPYGAGSPYKADSPNNPYGSGLKVYRP